MEWTPAKNLPPKSDDPRDDIAGWTYSKPVLILQSCGRVTIGHYMYHDDEDEQDWNKWVECCRDAYDVENVTHWMHLPKPPE